MVSWACSVVQGYVLWPVDLWSFLAYWHLLVEFVGFWPCACDSLAGGPCVYMELFVPLCRSNDCLFLVAYECLVSVKGDRAI